MFLQFVHKAGKTGKGRVLRRGGGMPALSVSDGDDVAIPFFDRSDHRKAAFDPLDRFIDHHASLIHQKLETNAMVVKISCSVRSSGSADLFVP